MSCAAPFCGENSIRPLTKFFQPSVTRSERLTPNDGGYLATGERLAAHIKTHYGDPTYIDHVVATHPDGDHTAGLRAILEAYPVGHLWMNRPWLYADELLTRFSRYTNRDNLIRDLKKAYPNTAILEEIAEKKGIPIYDASKARRLARFA